MFIHKSLEMFNACIHVGLHNHPMSSGVCCELLDIVFQCVAKVVFRTPIVKNSTIVMAARKQFMAD